jgi:hypothetical protein
MWCLQKMKWIWLLHLTCAAAALVQLGFVLWNGYIRPSITNTRVEEMKWKDMDVPVVLKICITPGFNTTAIKEMGYDNGVYGYFGGARKYNETILGWAGHTNTSGVQGSVAEVLRRVRAHTALCMKIEKGAAFKLLVQKQHFLSHSSQHCQIIDGLRGQTGVNLSLVGLELSEQVKDDLDEVEDDNVETEQNTKTLIQAEAHVV